MLKAHIIPFLVHLYKGERGLKAPAYSLVLDTWIMGKWATSTELMCFPVAAGQGEGQFANGEKYSKPVTSQFGTGSSLATAQCILQNLPKM